MFCDFKVFLLLTMYQYTEVRKKIVLKLRDTKKNSGVIIFLHVCVTSCAYEIIYLSIFLSILMQLLCWKCFINTGFFWLKQMKLNSSWEVHHTFHKFSLKGSQIASWFPSFSVEVMHTRVNNLMEGQLPESRIEAMVRIERSSKLSGSKSEVFLVLRVLLSRPFLCLSVCLFVCLSVLF